MTDTYRILGGPGSPYSHKLRAAFRYRRIPHTWKVPQGAFTGGGSLGGDEDRAELSEAGKATIPVVRYPEGAWWSDTTPIILDLETRHQGRSLVPPNRGLAFLDHLIEDMADEFLPIPMFHYRWTDDQAWCSKRQMIGWMGAINDTELEERAQAFLDRQFGQLTGGGRGGPQREQMEHAWKRFMEVMENHLRHNLFLFGTRPALSDLAIYGQLTQYHADPTLSSMMREKAIRMWQWTLFADDLSGIDGEWGAPEDVLTPDLEALLSYTAEFYVPMNELIMAFNTDSDIAGSANGAAYRKKCFLALKRELQDLDDESRQTIRPILEKTGLWEPLQFKDGEQEQVVPVTMI